MPREIRLQPGLYLLCPSCRGTMDRVEMNVTGGGFCVDRCPDCGGIWLDATELQKVIALKGSINIDKLDAGKLVTGGNTGTRTMRQCPRDGSALAPTQAPTQHHVILDKCPACLGLYLDAGELKDLAEVTLAERIVGFFSA